MIFASLYFCGMASHCDDNTDLTANCFLFLPRTMHLKDHWEQQLIALMHSSFAAILCMGTF